MAANPNTHDQHQYTATSPRRQRRWRNGIDLSYCPSDEEFQQLRDRIARIDEEQARLRAEYEETTSRLELIFRYAPVRLRKALGVETEQDRIAAEEERQRFEAWRMHRVRRFARRAAGGL